MSLLYLTICTLEAFFTNDSERCFEMILIGDFDLLKELLTSVFILFIWPHCVSCFFSLFSLLFNLSALPLQLRIYISRFSFCTKHLLNVSKSLFWNQSRIICAFGLFSGFFCINQLIKFCNFTEYRPRTCFGYLFTMLWLK